ncbi:hypothetical protein ACJ41O_006548 [Fusarium nematophilum]
MAQVVDAAIVGAGLSGLQAATDIHQAGLSVVVLEARDRVGGKTHTVDRKDGKGLQELGAAWLNNSNQSHIWSWCEKLNLTPVVQATSGLVASEDELGNCQFFPFGGTPQTNHDTTIVAIRDKVEAASLDPETFVGQNRVKLGSLSFEQWLQEAGAGPEALLTARVWCRGTLGQDPGDVSTLYFLEIARGALGIANLRSDAKHGAQHLRLVEGTQAISVGMAKLLPQGTVRLNTPVSSIVQSKTTPAGFKVTTTTGETFSARRVIVSIPSPTYKNITFEPILCPGKQRYLDSARYGCFVKFICLFKSPFWRSVGACGLSQSFRGPVNHCRDTSIGSDGNYALTCFLVSGPGQRWLALDEYERRESVLRQLGALFSVGYERVKSEFLGSMTSDWMEDKWAGYGCPFVAMPPGILTEDVAPELLVEEHYGLYFVGTELTEEWRGYMEGALRSGKAGASRLITDTRRSRV